MNVEFHYYSTAFLAVKAGFPLAEAETLAYAGTFVDHHRRAWRLQTPQGERWSPATQSFTFWDPKTVAETLLPFHFLPTGLDDQGRPPASVRRDGATSVWEVRPNSAPARQLLVEALNTRNLHRIGLALHTFSDTWAHQNFTGRNEAWNRLDPASPLPAPGHAQAGWSPDQWGEVWEDPRLVEARVENDPRFFACAAKVYRYLCTYRGKDFRADEASVAEALAEVLARGRGRATSEERMLEFVLDLNLTPYDPRQWMNEALEDATVDTEEAPVWERWRQQGEELLGRAGLAPPRSLKTRPGWEARPLAAWLDAVEAHRSRARELASLAVGGPL